MANPKGGEIAAALFKLLWVALFIMLPV